MKIQILWSRSAGFRNLEVGNLRYRSSTGSLYLKWAGWADGKACERWKCCRYPLNVLVTLLEVFDFQKWFGWRGRRNLRSESFRLNTANGKWPQDKTPKSSWDRGRSSCSEAILTKLSPKNFDRWCPPSNSRHASWVLCVWSRNWSHPACFRLGNAWATPWLHFHWSWLFWKRFDFQNSWKQNPNPNLLRQSACISELILSRKINDPISAILCHSTSSWKHLPLRFETKSAIHSNPSRNMFFFQVWKHFYKSRYLKEKKFFLNTPHGIRTNAFIFHFKFLSDTCDVLFSWIQKFHQRGFSQSNFSSLMTSRLIFNALCSQQAGGVNMKRQRCSFPWAASVIKMKNCPISSGALSSFISFHAANPINFEGHGISNFFKRLSSKTILLRCSPNYR